MSRNVVKHIMLVKKGKLSCCRCLFDQIKANLANIQPENLQKKSVLGKKLQESMGLQNEMRCTNHEMQVAS